MTVRMALAVLAVLALAACQPAGTAAPEPAATATAAAPVAVQPAATPAKPACAPAPALAKAPDFPDIGASFAKLEANFATAYGKACNEGLLKAPLIPTGVPHPGRLSVINAPDANVASLYRGGEDGKGDMLLEYHFVGSDGSHAVPSADDLHEAIFCAVQGASEAEQDDSGRCLAD